MNRQQGITKGNLIFETAHVFLDPFETLEDLTFTCFLLSSLPVFTGRLVWQHMQPTVRSVPVSPWGCRPAV